MQKEENEGVFKTLRLIMAIGQLINKTPKEKNDWDIRMLKAGLENKGLIIPEDWDTLSEGEKTERLDKIKQFI